MVGSSKFGFAYYITGFLILLGVLLGRFVCGFLCPFGWFQELLHKLPTKKFSTKRLKPLTYLKYYLLELLHARKPASLKTCVLLDKSARREVAVHVDYCGFSMPDAFVVGYGLDYAGRWRHLPDIHSVSAVGS